VPCGAGLQATWRDLDAAAYSALEFARLLKAGVPILGDGVPLDALTRGAALAEILGVLDGR
jgi:hypothetical protein